MNLIQIAFKYVEFEINKYALWINAQTYGSLTSY